MQQKFYFFPFFLAFLLSTTSVSLASEKRDAPAPEESLGPKKTKPTPLMRQKFWKHEQLQTFFQMSVEHHLEIEMNYTWNENDIELLHRHQPHIQSLIFSGYCALTSPQHLNYPFQNLKSLVFFDTPLAGKMQTLGPWIQAMPQLHQLSFSHTGLQPNEAPHLDAILGQTTQLEVLSLYGNFLGIHTLTLIANHTAVLKQLRKLSLVGNFRGEGSIGTNEITPFVDALSSLSSLESINIGALSITAEACQYLFRSINLSNLVELRMEDLGINGKTLETVTEFAQKHRDLKVLDLTGNKIKSSTDITHLAKTITSQEKLENLNLNHNSIGKRILQLVSEIPATAPLIFLKHLSLAWCKLEDQGITALAEAFPSIPNLENLNFAANDFTHLGAEALSKGLNNVPNLKVLRLTNNEIGDRGFQFLCFALKPLTNLESIDLSNNGLTATSSNLLGEMYAALPNVTAIALKASELGDQGVKNLAIYLAARNNLQDMDLSENGIGADGLEALIPVFKNNPNLVSLDLGDNHLTEATCATLAPVLGEFQKLQDLKLHNNPLGPGSELIASIVSGWVQLKELILMNTGLTANGFAILIDCLTTLEAVNFVEVSENPDIDQMVKSLNPKPHYLIYKETVDL